MAALTLDPSITRLQRAGHRRVAYVNPVVAVVLGHFLGGEVLDRRTVLGSVLVLGSVIVITGRSRTNTVSAPASVAGASQIQPDTKP
ncbi:MAG: hypothetical protein ACREV7_15560 [Steroidobacteraceae bacterium]